MYRQGIRTRWRQFILQMWMFRARCIERTMWGMQAWFCLHWGWCATLPPKQCHWFYWGKFPFPLCMQSGILPSQLYSITMNQTMDSALYPMCARLSFRTPEMRENGSKWNKKPSPSVGLWLFWIKSVVSMSRRFSTWSLTSTAMNGFTDRSSVVNLIIFHHMSWI